jgi:hypothetical protein
MALSCLIACTSSSTIRSSDTTIIDYKLTQGKPLNPSEWHFYNINDEEKICIPSTWTRLNQDKYLFMSDLSRLSPGAYFVVFKVGIRKSSFNDATKYLTELYLELKNDSSANFVSYTTFKIRYNDKTTFNSEFHTLVNNVPYVTYSTIFERGGNLYDISLKTEQSKAKQFEENYKDILFNFYYKNKLVFSIKDKITKVETIDLSKL